jgi:hypothetical protein
VVLSSRRGRTVVWTGSLALEDEALRERAHLSSFEDTSLQWTRATASSSAWRRRSTGGSLTRMAARIGPKDARPKERGGRAGLREASLWPRLPSVDWKLRVLGGSHVILSSRRGRTAAWTGSLALEDEALRERAHLSSFGDTSLQWCQPPVTIDPLAPLILTPLLRPVHSALMLPALTSPALFFCFSL